MTQREKELFKSLCSFKNEYFDDKLLDAATPTVLGHLFFNRMQTIAYGTLKNHNLLDSVNREFRNSLKSAYEKNLEKNDSFFKGIKLVEEALSVCNCKYAMLKGAYLCKLYPAGYRTANDIDLLVNPEDITEIGSALLKADFKQGKLKNGQLTPATRKEIIESKMTRGETVPYIKEVDLPGMRFLEVDINFSLDYKPGDSDLVDAMMNETVIQDIGNVKIHTLRDEDFFIHLCCHLYKEATTMPWIKMKRDMTLYKFCDIYTLLYDTDKKYVDLLFRRAHELGTAEVCAYSVIHTAELFQFDNSYAVAVAKRVLQNDPEFLHRIMSPAEKKTYIYVEKNISERLFADDRTKMLKEIC